MNYSGFREAWMRKTAALTPAGIERFKSKIKWYMDQLRTDLSKPVKLPLRSSLTGTVKPQDLKALPQRLQIIAPHEYIHDIKSMPYSVPGKLSLLERLTGKTRGMPQDSALYDAAKKHMRYIYPSGQSEFTSGVLPWLNPNGGGIDNYAKRQAIKKALPNATAIGKELKRLGLSREEISNAIQHGPDMNESLRATALNNIHRARHWRALLPDEYEAAKADFRKSVPALKSGEAGPVAYAAAKRMWDALGKM